MLVVQRVRGDYSGVVVVGWVRGRMMWTCVVVSSSVLDGSEVDAPGPPRGPHALSSCCVGHHTALPRWPH